MRLDTLAIGTPFILPSSGLTGTLERLGASAATVRYEGTTEVVIDGQTSFERRNATVAISLGTEVTLT